MPDNILSNEVVISHLFTAKKYAKSAGDFFANFDSYEDAGSELINMADSLYLYLDNWCKFLVAVWFYYKNTSNQSFALSVISYIHYYTESGSDKREMERIRDFMELGTLSSNKGPVMRYGGIVYNNVWKSKPPVIDENIYKPRLIPKKYSFIDQYILLITNYNDKNEDDEEEGSGSDDDENEDDDDSSSSSSSSSESSSESKSESEHEKETEDDDNNNNQVIKVDDD
jgi:hypothetical protein